MDICGLSRRRNGVVWVGIDNNEKEARGAGCKIYCKI